jgi:hypothetical protein
MVAVAVVVVEVAEDFHRMDRKAADVRHSLVIGAEYVVVMMLETSVLVMEEVQNSHNH